MPKKFDRSLIPPVPNLEFERGLWKSGIDRIAGIDEAGRGALAGPVCAAAVVLPNKRALGKKLSGVRDSKQMKPSEREEWAARIFEIAIEAECGFASSREIDEIGIVPATRKAAIRAMDKFSQKPQHLLIDYISIPAAGLPETSLVKGDARSLSIACASVLAKVGRDEIMIALENEYPGYGLARNKGYGTREHRLAIADLGGSKDHRKSFAPLRLKLFLE